MIAFVVFDLPFYIAESAGSPFYISLIFVWIVIYTPIYLTLMNRFESKYADMAMSSFVSFILALVATGFMMLITMKIHGNSFL